jgi:hypothetical protein
VRAVLVQANATAESNSIPVSRTNITAGQSIFLIRAARVAVNMQAMVYAASPIASPRVPRGAMNTGGVVLFCTGAANLSGRPGQPIWRVTVKTRAATAGKTGVHYPYRSQGKSHILLGMAG